MKTLRTKYLSIALLFTIIVSSTGCETLDVNRKKLMTYGGGIACAAGAAVVSKDWGDIGRIAGIGGSGIACGYLGKWLSDYLDEREKEQAIEAAKEVLRNPNKKSAAWESETNSGVKGTATVISAAQNDCQDVEMKVFKDGKQHKTVTKFCKDSDGVMSPA